jgi:hypothetical protein
MKTLIYAPTHPDIAKQAQKWLEMFGKGLHVSAIGTAECQDAILGEHWSHAIIVDASSLPSSVHCKGASHVDTCGRNLADADDFRSLRHDFYVIYRDILQDMVGTRCSCGLYDMCHCH